jgi:multicomponent Na+:H+ antiporter subunit E
MTLLLFLFLLAMTYALLVGFKLLNLIIGFLLGLAILAILPQGPVERGKGHSRLKSGRHLLQLSKNLFWFTLDFVWDLTVSNVQIAWDVWTPKDYYTPKIVEVPVGDLTPMQLMLLASRITLTPGTLSADVTEDRKILLVHMMYPGKDNPAARLRKPIDMLKKGL